MSALSAMRDNYASEFGRQKYNLLGEVISWNLAHNTRISYADLLQALRVSQLVPEDKIKKFARELLPRYAFSRAANKMSEDRIIRKVAEQDGKLAFQFTKEYLSQSGDNKRFDYQFEATLILDKESGAIECDNSDLAELARKLLQEATDTRTTADITRVIQKLFEKNADLFPIRDSGGVYFVPDTHTEFTEKVERFVRQLNGTLTRFPVPEGTRQGNQSVQEAVTAGLQAILKEHQDAIDNFTTDTRSKTFERHLEKIQVTQLKIEGYSAYLEEKRTLLDARVEELRQELKRKLAEAMEAQD